MKPLALVLSALILLPAYLRAQVAAEADSLGKMNALKKKYAKEAQKPQAASWAPLTGSSTTVEISIPDLQKLVLMDDSCSAKAAETADLASGLKDKYGIVSCRTGGGLQVVVLTPKSIHPDQQVVYHSVPGHELLGGRLFGHYVVVELGGQRQYRDLLSFKAPEGFPLGGFAEEGWGLYQFDDAAAFADALKRYAGFKDEALADVSAYAAKVANGRTKINFEAHQAAPEWAVFASFDKELWQLWPKDKRGLKK